MRSARFPVLLFSPLLISIAHAGEMTPPGAPGTIAGGMYTTQDICNRLDAGTAGTIAGFNEPSAGPGPEGTGCSYNEIMEKAPAVDDTDGAAAGDVLAGKTFWGLRSDGTWGTTSGSMPTQTLSDSSTTVTAGYYEGTDLVTVDSDLSADKIQSGVNLFGIVGTHTGIGGNVQDTSSGDALEGEILSGKKAWVDGSEVTGTMPTQTLSATTTTVSAGYYTATNLTTVDSDLSADKIQAGVELFGIEGTHTGIGGNVQDTSSGDALEGEILSGKKAWVDGSEVTGTMPTQTLSAASTTVSAGYYAATNLTTVDGDLSADKIQSGVNLFGIDGTHTGIGGNVQDTSSGDALEGEILSGKKAWVDGSEVTGAMPTQTLSATTTTVSSGYYAATNLTTVDSDLSADKIQSGVNLFGIEGSHTGIGGNVQDTSSGDALEGEILSGKKAWVDGSEVIGTMANVGTQTITPGASSKTITQGYHDGNGSVAGDADLIAGNIKDGVEVFGVTGEYPVAAVPKTGQTTCYDPSGSTTNTISCTGTGQDGDLQKGATQSGYRFTINGDGTVTDNQTGLIWLANANCPGSKNWADALTFANSLYDGWTGDGSGGDCGLSDGSSAGDWRLPNVKELQSLIDFAYFSPALSNATGTAKWTSGDPFSGVQSLSYWSSTSFAGSPNGAWGVGLGYGNVGSYGKTGNNYVWPVRGGQ